MSSRWEAKYEALRRQCIDIERNNLKLMNRIYHVKRMTKRTHKERKAIMDRLDLHNDNFRSFDLFFDGDVLKENAIVKPQKMAKIEKDRTGVNSSIKYAQYEYSDAPDHFPEISENAYLMFCKYAKSDILGSKPNMSQTEVAKLLAEKWAQLRPSEKEAYYRMYEQSKESCQVTSSMEQDMPTNFKDIEFNNGERGSISARRGLVLSPNLTSFTDNSDLQSSIALPQIPSPTLTDVDHPFAMSTIPSPSFR